MQSTYDLSPLLRQFVPEPRSLLLTLSAPDEEEEELQVTKNSSNKLEEFRQGSITYKLNQELSALAWL